jgi:ABC-type transport system involved in multi-copper enzyme maturation permease subunit
LVRLARRGHAARSRILLLYSLLLALIAYAFVWSYPFDPMPLLLGTASPLGVSQAAAFANRLTLVLLESQLLLVAVLTPAYAVSTISEEKDRHTLSLLLATRLTDWEIVWGKAAARAVFVLAAVAAGVPVLALMLLLGVEPSILAAGYALAFGTAILSVGIGVNAACRCSNSNSALVRAYVQSAAIVGGLFVPLFILLSPFAMLIYHAELQDAGVRFAAGFGYPLGQMILGCVLINDGVKSLRNAGTTAGPLPTTGYPEPPRGRALPVLLDSPEAVTESPTRPPFDFADPILWKERHAGQPIAFLGLERPLRVFIAVCTICAAALFVGGGWTLVKRAVRALDPDEAALMLRIPEGSPDRAGLLFVSAGVLASVLYLLPLTVNVTEMIAGERFRGTLDSLLATSLDRQELLRLKIRAVAEKGLVYAGGAAAALGAGFAVEGGLRPALAVLAVFAAGIGLVIGCGAWLSVRCGTPTRALRFCLPVTVLVGGLPALMWSVTDWSNPVRLSSVLLTCAIVFAGVGAVLRLRACVELDRGEC